MSGVLRIAWSFFWFVPLQRWINLVGAACLLLALLLVLLGGMDATALRNGSIACLVGCMIIGLVPGYAGGAALRLASTRCQMHLRPRGRVRMLLGATLTITLLAAMVAAPVLLLQLANQALHSSAAAVTPYNGITPLDLFGIAWSCIALLWCSMFFATGSLLLLFPIMLLTPVLMKLPPLLLQSPVGIAPLVIAGLGAWLAFARWYTNARKLDSPVFSGWRGQSEQHDPRESAARGPIERLGNMVGRVMALLTGSRRDPRNVAQANRLVLIGTLSPLAQIAVGTLLALFLMIPWLVMPGNKGIQPVPALGMTILSMMPGNLAYMIVRRARFLWLRGGLDRAQLFAVAEKTGLAASAFLVATPFVSLLGMSLWNSPDQAAVLLLYALGHAVFASCVFYAALTAVRGWDVGGVLVAAVVFLVYVGSTSNLVPRRGVSVTVEASLLLLLLLVAGALRWYARRRWLTLDWRIALLPTMPRGV